MRVDRDGRGFVAFAENLTGSPCTDIDPGYENAQSFDANTAGGKSIYALVLSAKAMKSMGYAKRVGGVHDL